MLISKSIKVQSYYVNTVCHSRIIPTKGNANKICIHVIDDVILRFE